MAQILATLDDINANLPSEDIAGAGPVAKADDENTDLLQLSVARVVRAYLSSVVDNATLMSWDAPENTPDTIKEIAAKLIAAQFYANRVARTNVTLELRHWAQLKYDEAMAMLQSIVSGQIIVVDESVVIETGLTVLDFHPVDDTDRAFSMGMEL